MPDRQHAGRAEQGAAILQRQRAAEHLHGACRRVRSGQRERVGHGFRQAHRACDVAAERATQSRRERAAANDVAARAFCWSCAVQRADVLATRAEVERADVRAVEVHDEWLADRERVVAAVRKCERALIHRGRALVVAQACEREIARTCFREGTGESVRRVADDTADGEAAERVNNHLTRQRGRVQIPAVDARIRHRGEQAAAAELQRGAGGNRHTRHRVVHGQRVDAHTCRTACR